MKSCLAAIVAFSAATATFGADAFKNSSLSADFSAKPYDSLRQAVKALNSKADAEYRRMTNDTKSDSMSVGEKGQTIAELAAFIVERRDSSGQPRYYITDFAKLGASGGKSGISSRGMKEGDKVIGYHTGRHSFGSLTTLSNTDYKGLKNANFFKKRNDGRGMVEGSFEAEIAYDAATGKNSGIDRNGALFSWDENDNLVDMVLTQADYCTPEMVSNTVDFMGSSDEVDSGPVCPPGQIERAQSIMSEIAKSQKTSHHCISFKHVKTREVKVERLAKEHGNWQVYECTECGRQTGFYDKDETIEEIIARNKKYQQLEGSNAQLGEGALRQMPSALQ